MFEIPVSARVPFGSDSFRLTQRGPRRRRVVLVECVVRPGQSLCVRELRVGTGTDRQATQRAVDAAGLHRGLGSSVPLLDKNPVF
jgi:hypothetical protein